MASASAQAVLLESTPFLKSSVGASGALLLTHSHTLGNIKEEVLAEWSHIPLAILAVAVGWSRRLELRLPPERCYNSLYRNLLTGYNYFTFMPVAAPASLPPV